MASEKNKGFGDTVEFRAIVNGSLAVFVFLPLSVQRDLSTLSKAGLVSICAIAYTSLVLIIEAPYYYRIYEPLS